MIKFDTYKFSQTDLDSRLAEIQEKKIPYKGKDFLVNLLNIIDLTSLEGNDTNDKIESICLQAIEYNKIYKKSVAAVCFYPTFMKKASYVLNGTDIRAVSVAGAFPSGHSSIKIKLNEVKYAINQGAEEIDMVISRGKFLEGNFVEVYEEIAAIKDICEEIPLKVILETGELNTVSNIRKASEIAINAGADFIKSSTGKSQPAATPHAIMIMADTIKEYHRLTGKKVGIKAAGGIASIEDATLYTKIILNILGPDWFNNIYFRIGASRLVGKITEALNDISTKE